VIFRSTILRIVNPLIYWYGSLSQGLGVGGRFWLGVGNFQLTDFDPLPTPPSVSGLSNLFALYQIIKHEKIQAVFQNMETILRLFLCLMVTNYSGDKSFSKLKRIKSVLRSTMWQERLSDPSILCGENDKLRLIDFDDTIDEFAARIDRRKMFWQ